MGYSREEQETTIVFDYVERVWNICTYCPMHITKLKKLTTKLNINLTVLEEENGKPIGIKCTLPEKAIMFREPIKRVYTEEQRKSIGERLNKKNEKVI